MTSVETNIKVQEPAGDSFEAVDVPSPKRALEETKVAEEPVAKKQRRVFAFGGGGGNSWFKLGSYTNDVEKKVAEEAPVVASHPSAVTSAGSSSTSLNSRIVSRDNLVTQPHTVALPQATSPANRSQLPSFLFQQHQQAHPSALRNVPFRPVAAQFDTTQQQQMMLTQPHLQQGVPAQGLLSNAFFRPEQAYQDDHPHHSRNVSASDDQQRELDHLSGAEDDTGSVGSDSSAIKFRAYQAENWTEKFEELIEFRQIFGHCLVPNAFPENPALAQWVKRQRYQYKLKNEGKRSTMSDERVAALEEVGFVWDSHSAVWDERLHDLLDYKQANGDCNVPSRYAENRQLAVWVKRQRRQYKFFCENLPSSMTEQRIQRLNAIGFQWDLKNKKN